MIVAAIDWSLTIPILIALVAGVAVGHFMRQARTRSKQARKQREALAKRAAKAPNRPRKTSPSKQSPALRQQMKSPPPGKGQKKKPTG